MREALGKVAVVRQQEQAFTLRVEPADIKQARKFRRQQIENRIVCVRIAPGRNKSSRFVERNRQRLLGVDELAVDFDIVALGVGLGAEICADLTVDRNAAVRD